VKLSHRILMYLLDGEPHKLGEFYDEIMNSIDPKMAVRKYAASAVTLDGKDLCNVIHEGKERTIDATLWIMAQENAKGREGDPAYITLERNGAGNQKAIVLQLTPSGLDKIRNVRPGSGVEGAIFKELRDLWHHGRVALSVTPVRTEAE
jgi:hypothetical protein